MNIYYDDLKNGGAVVGLSILACALIGCLLVAGIKLTEKRIQSTQPVKACHYDYDGGSLSLLDVKRLVAVKTEGEERLMVGLKSGALVSLPLSIANVEKIELSIANCLKTL